MEQLRLFSSDVEQLLTKAAMTCSCARRQLSPLQRPRAKTPRLAKERGGIHSGEQRLQQQRRPAECNTCITVDL